MTADERQHAACAAAARTAAEHMVRELGLDPRMVAGALFVLGAGGIAFSPNREGELAELRRIADELVAVLDRAERPPATAAAAVAAPLN